MTFAAFLCVLSSKRNPNTNQIWSVSSDKTHKSFGTASVFLIIINPHDICLFSIVITEQTGENLPGQKT